MCITGDKTRDGSRGLTWANQMQPVVVGDYRDGPSRRTCVFDILAIWFP
jgi:hypothetical protein